MIIYKPDNEPFMTIDVDDESYHYAEIMGRDDVTVYFSLPHFVDFPLGCYITYMANTYTLYTVDKMRMEHRRDYEYTITFESAAAELQNYILTLFNSFAWWGWHGTSEGNFKFPFTARSQEHLQLIATCMTQKTGQTWTVGNYVDGGDKLISYDTMTCLDALKQIADTFGTEYSIVGRTINLGKVEFYTNVQDQVTISYGKGNGLRPGVEKTVDTSERAIGKLYVQGGDRNIDPSEYGSSTLHMPVSMVVIPDPSRPGQTITVDRYWWYDGHTVSDTQFEGAKKFSCPTGSYIVLAEDDVPLGEGALDLSEIYPHFEHYIDEAVEVDRENSLWDIYSDEFTAGESYRGHINYGECQIANDEALTVVFQSGRLAGRQFAVDWATKDDPDHEGQQIGYMKIVADEQDGIKMPNYERGFYPARGDTFRVFNCYLPDQYIEEAEMEMLEQALSYLWERMTPQYSIKGEVDPIWSSSRWLNIGGHFKPGAYFRFVDPVWENEGVSIRVTNVKTYLNKPHMPIVELSSGVSKQGVATALKKIEAQAKVVPQSFNYANKAFTKRSFADAKETMEMLIKAGLDNFTEAINPITVQTMQMIVGDESLQFMFFTDRTCVTQITNPLTYNASTKQLTSISCALKHMTLGIKDIRPDRENDDYLRWNMAAYESAVLDEPDKPYYVYAKCDALNNGTNHLGGEFILSETAIAMERDVYKSEGVITGGYYHFLVGILNAERDDDRSFAPLFGFTEVLPGQITTDVIRGASGESWWDLVQNIVRIGSQLYYSPASGLILNGALVQTGDSEYVSIGAWCGEWDSGTYYQNGDEVWIEDANGIISTYRYVANVRTKNVQPPNESYWQVSAEGKMGRGIYGSPADSFWKYTTTDGQNPPSGSESNWVSSRPTTDLAGKYIWKRTITTYSDNTTSTTYTSEYHAADGTDGDPGPWLNSRGEWSSTELYVGGDDSCDVVHYTDGKWYMANRGVGDIPVGTLPTNTSYWSAFEANFSNIATGLLFVEREYVNNLFVRDLETGASPYNGSIRAMDNYLMMFDELNQPKLVITGNELDSLSNATGSSGSWRDGYENAVSGSVTVDAYVEQIYVSQAENSVSLSSNSITIMRGTGSGQNTAEEATMTAAYYIDNTAVSSVSANFTFEVGQTTKVFTLPRTNRRVSTGNHQIYIKITASTPNSNNLSRAAYSSGTVEVSYPTEAVQIGANGFRAAFSPTSYAAFTKESGSVNYTIRNGNYGIQVSSTGIKMTFNGSTWYTASRDSSGNLVLLSN